MGVIIPPSILMIVWGGVMSVSVGSLFLAGAVPGLMIAFALMATVYGYAVVYDYPIAGKPTLADFWTALKGAGLALLPPVFVIGGIVSLSFGLVTPPYGLCLLISASIAKVNVINCLRDVAIILAPMLLILLIIIIFPGLVLWLPKLLMPGFK